MHAPIQSLTCCNTEYQFFHVQLHRFIRQLDWSEMYLWDVRQKNLRLPGVNQKQKRELKRSSTTLITTKLKLDLISTFQIINRI